MDVFIIDSYRLDNFQEEYGSTFSINCFAQQTKCDYDVP